MYKAKQVRQDKPKKDGSDKPKKDGSDKPKRSGSDKPKRSGSDKLKRSGSDKPKRSGTDKNLQPKSLPEIREKEIWRPGNMLYPLPAVMVSCAREGERPNIITVAWAGTVCTNPPMVSISVRPERYSHDIIEQSGEFVINLVTKELTQACDWCGVRSGDKHDKFARCGLDAAAGEKMRYAPLIAQSPVNIECVVEQKIPLGSHDMFLARVVSVHVDRSGLDEKGRYDLGRAGLITYSHGEYYALGEKLGSFGYSVKKQKMSRAD